ncbi:MAG: ABC transporter permease [Nanoarchaeota archaeon]
MNHYFFLAFNNLRRRKLRSWLTILGIFIGIASIVAFITLGQGLENYINEQFEQVGTNIIMIMGKAGSVVSPIASSISDKPLTKRDVDLINKISGVDIASAMIICPTQIKFGKETEGLLLYGMEPKDIDELFGHLSSFKIDKGRQLKESDKYVAVVGSRFNEIYKKEIDIGSKVEIDKEEFKIIGILKSIGNPQDDKSIYVPNDILREITNEPDKVSMIYVQTEKGKAEETAKRIETKMRKDRDEKEGEESFSVSTSEQLLETFGNILGVVQAVFIGIAAISLLVGGIGIMNTMYTSVLERTKEIGTMKAVGAKNSDILFIFLIESGLIGFIGGLIGLILGMGISKTVEYVVVNFYGITLLKIIFEPTMIFFVLGFSFIVGCIAGTLPAFQASKLKPADALRYE